MNISVIIPVLNEAPILETALRQISSLKGNFEVIVVDGGSTDDTLAIAGRFARVLKSRKGRSAQMNIGAKESGGNVLLFLHADTRLPETALSAIAESMNDPAVIGGRFKVRLDEPGWRYRMVGSGINLRDRFFNGFTGDQAIFIRRRAFYALGGYREMPLMEDLDMGRRMCRYGKVVRLPLTVVTSARRWKNSGVFKTIFLMWALRLSYLLGRSPQQLYRLYGDTR